MFVTTVRIPELDDAVAAKLIRTLSEIRSRGDAFQIKGFVQCLLLRGRGSSAMLVTSWESRNDMVEYNQSSAGSRAQELIASAVEGTNVEYDEYRATWRGAQDVAVL